VEQNSLSTFKKSGAKLFIHPLLRKGDGLAPPLQRWI